MSGVNGNTADVESGKASPVVGEEESKPLIEKLHDAGIIKPSSDGDTEEVTKSVLKKRGANRSAEINLDTSPGEKKQLLFRTSSGDGKGVAVHYRSNQDDQAGNGGNVSMLFCVLCVCVCSCFVYIFPTRWTPAIDLKWPR